MGEAAGWVEGGPEEATGPLILGLTQRVVLGSLCSAGEQGRGQRPRCLSSGPGQALASFAAAPACADVVERLGKALVP